MTQITFEPPPERTGPLLEGVPNGKLAIWWYQWFQKIASQFTSLSGGLNVTITTAKLTPGGVNGQMIFTNGVLTGQTQST